MTKKNRAELERQCMFEPRYSGEDSARFWSAVNKANDLTLYTFGCALQDVESLLLAELNEHVRRDVGKAIRASAAKKPRRSTR